VVTEFVFESVDLFDNLAFALCYCENFGD